MPLCTEFQYAKGVMKKVGQMKEKIKLTRAEEEVMELLWKSNAPLSASDIVRLSVNRTWKPSYIHLMLKSLLKKEVIQVVGLRRTARNYARTFAPVMSKEEWNLFQLKQNIGETVLLKELVALERREEVLDELAELIKRRKEVLHSIP